MLDFLAQFDQLETPRLNIRPLQVADCEPFFSMTNDTAILSAIPFLPDPFTPTDALTLIEGIDGGRHRFVGVWERASLALAGVVGINLRDESDVEIGYWFGSSFHAKGYATEAVGAVLVALRRLMPSRRIIAECRPENTRSWSVLRKLGFRTTDQAGTRAGRMLLELTKD